MLNDYARSVLTDRLRAPAPRAGGASIFHDGDLPTPPQGLEADRYWSGQSVADIVQEVAHDLEEDFKSTLSYDPARAGTLAENTLTPQALPDLLAAGTLDPSILAYLLAFTPLSTEVVTAACYYPRPQVRQVLAERYSQMTGEGQRILDQAALTDTDAYVRALVAAQSTDAAVLALLATCPESGVADRAAARAASLGYPLPPAAPVLPGLTGTPGQVSAALERPAWGEPLDEQWEASTVASRMLANGVGGRLTPIDAVSAAADEQWSRLRVPGNVDGPRLVSDPAQAAGMGLAELEQMKLLTAELALTWGETSNVGGSSSAQQVLLDAAARRGGAGDWDRPRSRTFDEDRYAQLTAQVGSLADAWMAATSGEASDRLRSAGITMLQVSRYTRFTKEQAAALGIPTGEGEGWSKTSMSGVPSCAISSFTAWPSRPEYEHPSDDRMVVFADALVPVESVIAMSGAVGNKYASSSLCGLDIAEVLLPPVHTVASQVRYTVITADGPIQVRQPHQPRSVHVSTRRTPTPQLSHQPLASQGWG